MKIPTFSYFFYLSYYLTPCSKQKWEQNRKKSKKKQSFLKDTNNRQTLKKIFPFDRCEWTLKDRKALDLPYVWDVLHPVLFRTTNFKSIIGFSLGWTSEYRVT